MSQNNHIKGNKGEELAAKHLQSKGFSILHRNWRYSKLEIDIIARSDDRIVFIEVKLRSGEEYGEPEVAVSIKKQRLLIKAANAFIIENDIQEEARFDIVGILFKPGEKAMINHIEDAFYPVG